MDATGRPHFLTRHGPPYFIDSLLIIFVCEGKRNTFVYVYLLLGRLRCSLIKRYVDVKLGNYA